MSLSLLENRRNFIVHCPSNVKLEGSDGHKNTPSHFYVPLPQKIPLETNEWEVGLSEIFIPSYGYNMKPSLNSSIQVYGKEHTAAGLRKKHRICIPKGRYFPKVYIRVLNEEIEHLEEGVQIRRNIRKSAHRGGKWEGCGDRQPSLAQNARREKRDDQLQQQSTGWENDRRDAETSRFQRQWDEYVRVHKCCGT